ncbi:alpha/beta hydrolase [Mesorhizobium sp. BAC0120]|uniref:alpha/beta hydrolase n=1 Tax=Mesorhizobium sp. BAC0120 TaxID=3090670 RepID=UPI00298CAB84|nr:alpha/beta hydrolase [Mesorhizobium sp. BAC0120]MDW6024539.1 alpha/beta hydrolase [Mesorhizobium sp. BAC0120]
MSQDISETIEVGGLPIAVRRQEGRAPGIIWLGGYRSDMTGTKAEALSAFAREKGFAFLRHDYSGHGASGGDFRAGTISRWLSESLAVFERFAAPRAILVGSSMGSWIALRMIEELRKRGAGGRIDGVVLIAPAPDFTAELIEPQLKPRQKRGLAEQGYIEEPSAYSPEPNVYTKSLIEDGRANLVLTGPIDTHCPVHILQGMADPDVPHTHALKLASLLPSDDLTVSLIPDGDHRLSRPQDLGMILNAIEAMAGT